MSRTLRRIILIIAVIFILSAAVIFAVYKAVVTPKVKLGLSFINAADDMGDSFDIFIDDDEEELLEYVTKRGGRLSYDFNISKSPLFEGTSGKFIIEGTASESVAELLFGDTLNFDIYKSQEEILINLPLYNGGLKIPRNSDKTLWENSAFSEAYEALPHYEAAAAVKYFKNNRTSIYNFAKANRGKLISWAKDLDAKQEKSEKVTIGSKDKTAQVFSVIITEDSAEKLSQIVDDYIKKNHTGEFSSSSDAIINFAKNGKILLKINNFKIRQVELISPSGDIYTIELTGQGNPFNDITYYKNSDRENAVIRTGRKTSNKITEIVKVGDDRVLSMERTKTKTEFVYDYQGKHIEVTASGNEYDENLLTINDLEIKVANQFSVSGRLSVMRRLASSAPEFVKSGQYIDVTQIPVDEWNIIKSALSEKLGVMQEF